MTSESTLLNALQDERNYVENLENEMNQVRSSEKKYRILYSQLKMNVDKEKQEKNEVIKNLECATTRIRELELGARRILAIQSNSKEDSIIHPQLEFDHIIFDKDNIIDSLRQELSNLKQENLKLKSSTRSKIEDMEKNHFFAKEEFDMNLHRKNGKIALLKDAVTSQQQTIKDMSEEMDHLQRGMETVARKKKEELEEMQQEIMDTKAIAAQQEREIATSKMKLEESKLKYQDEIAKLKEKITILEAETPMQRNIQEQRDDERIDELNNTIQELRWRNCNLEDDCQEMRVKLASVERTQKSSKNDKWRKTALKEEIQKLKTKVRELEVHFPVNNKSPQHSLDSSHSPLDLMTPDSPCSVQI